VGAVVIGREKELDSIQTFLGGVEVGPASLVITGEPGVGKTILWNACVERAEGQLGCVLSCRAVEAEASLSFAALADLFGERLGDGLTALAGPRRRALEIALLIEEPGLEASDQRAIALAFLDVLRAFAERGPVLVAVDDVHWLDSSSACVLQFAFRRLRNERIGLLATLREGPGIRLPLDLDNLELLSLGPLSLGSLHQLLKKRLGLDLTRPEIARLHKVTGGNPFFALELGRELGRAKARLAPGEPLPVPDNLLELVGGRLARLPKRTGEVLLSAAALARPTAEVLAMAHGEQTEAALERAVRAGVIELEGSRIRFSHPLIAAVCYGEAPVWKRRAAHRLLAEVVSDAEERARHLALACDRADGSVADALAGAAERAAGRGATAAAAELAELAAELTPADGSLKRRRFLRAADFHCFSGDRERAAAIPKRLLADVPAGGERADVLFALASARTLEIPAIIEICEEAMREAAGDDARCTRILAFLSWTKLLAGDVPGALADARSGLEKAERLGRPEPLARALGRIAALETWTTEITPGLLERAVALEEQLARPLEYWESPTMAFGRHLVQLGQLDRARTVLAREEQRAAAGGDEGSRVHLLFHLTMLEWFSGRWERALEYADQALELAEQIHDDLYRGMTLFGKAHIEALLGRLDVARAAAEEGVILGEATADALFPIWNLGVLGHIELTLGHLETAARYLRPLPERLISLGWNDVVDPLWPDAIETLVGLGDLAQARVYLDYFEVQGRRRASPWALGAAARCRGLLAAAEQDLPAAFEALEHALAMREWAQFPFERGRTLLALGSVHRRAKQKRAAREALEQALAVFDELGAPLWAAKGRKELARIGGRRRASKELTEAEERVASLAAEGRSNKQIAAALFVSVHTVEAHLSRIYRKLKIRSRAELAHDIAASEHAMSEDAAAKV
jgi:DNA-binding CsgD family transcriptional regulator